MFGMCDTSQTPALGVTAIVLNRSAATLLPILQQHLRSGTTIHSDQWAAYNLVQQLPSVTVHNTVNHSLHFVDPGTGVHTQNVESYWNRYAVNSDRRTERRRERRRERRAAECSEQRETRLARRRVADRARFAAISR